MKHKLVDDNLLVVEGQDKTRDEIQALIKEHYPNKEIDHVLRVNHFIDASNMTRDDFLDIFAQHTEKRSLNNGK